MKIKIKIKLKKLKNNKMKMKMMCLNQLDKILKKQASKLNEKNSELKKNLNI